MIKLISRTLLMSCCAGFFFLMAYAVLIGTEFGSMKQRLQGAIVTACPGGFILYVEYLAWQHYLKQKPNPPEDGFGTPPSA